MSTDTIRFLMPEMVLVAVATLVYLGGAFVASRGIWSWIAAAGIGAAALALWQPHAEPGMLIHGDFFATYVRWLVLALGMLWVMLSARSAAEGAAAEYYGSLLMVIAGLMITSIAADLVLLFLGLELISIPTYLLLYLARRDPASQEVTTKYFFLSVLASALLLYGFSFLYGVAGTTRLDALQMVLQDALAKPDGAAAAFRSLAALGLVLVFAGLGFRLAAVPFHFYAPDVFQGTTHGNAALLSAAPKIAAVVALVRIVAIAMSELDPAIGWQIAVVLALVTMTLGNVLALWQDNVRRLMAYSSIAHGGYMLIGLAVALAAAKGAASVGDFDGVAAMILYLTVYALATTGIFAALAYLGRSGEQLNDVDELAGLARTRPLAAFALAVCLFSLTGIPPLAGFWGKLTLFSGALGISSPSSATPFQTWFLVLAIGGVLNAAIAAAYYLRLVAAMYFRSPASTPHAQGGIGAWAAMVVCAVCVTAAGLYPAPLVRNTQHAADDAQGKGIAPEHVRQADRPHADQRVDKHALDG